MYSVTLSVCNTSQSVAASDHYVIEGADGIMDVLATTALYALVQGGILVVSKSNSTEFLNSLEELKEHRSPLTISLLAIRKDLSQEDDEIVGAMFRRAVQKSLASTANSIELLPMFQVASEVKPEWMENFATIVCEYMSVDSVKSVMVDGPPTIQ